MRIRSVNMLSNPSKNSKALKTLKCYLTESSPMNKGKIVYDFLVLKEIHTNEDSSWLISAAKLRLLAFKEMKSSNA